MRRRTEEGIRFMENVYVICAVVGGTLFLCQFLLGLVGIGHHGMDGGHDVAHDAGHGHGGHGHGDPSSVFLHVLSFRAMIAAITFFGLTGIAAQRSTLEPIIVVGMAIGAGLLAMFAVAAIMGFLSRLQSDGTVHIEQALGKTGTVYLTVPQKNAGQGKVTVTVQSRTMEYLAVTFKDALPTGSKIVVVDIVSPDTVAVAAASEEDLKP